MGHFYVYYADQRACLSGRLLSVFFLFFLLSCLLMWSVEGGRVFVGAIYANV